MGNTLKPQDVVDVLTASQSVIDAAVQVVSETKKTQQIFNENIKLTDTKIGEHNVDDESHQDIREMLVAIPDMITPPEITGPDSIESGTEGTWTLTSSTSVESISIDAFEVTYPGGNERIPATSGSGTFTHTFTADTNTTIKFSVYTVGTVNGMEYRTSTVEHSVNITTRMPPDLSAMVVSLPERISQGETYQFTVSGITDPDDDFEYFDIQCTDSKLTFSEKTNIQQGTQLTLTVASGYNGPADIPYTILASDSVGLTNSKTLTLKLNAAPSASTITTTLPSTMQGGTSNQVTFTISGGSDDDDDQPFTYSLEDVPAGLTFSKTTNITSSDQITLTATKVNNDISKIFNVKVTDSLGATSTDKKAVSITVQPVYVTARPTITAPLNGAEVPSTGFTIQWTAVAADVDMS